MGRPPADSEVMASWSTACLDGEAAGRYVLGRRTPSGGYSFYRTPEWGVEEPNAPDTLAALECLRLLDLPAPEPELTAKWLRSLQDGGGGYPTLTIGWATLRALAILGYEPDRRPTAWVAEHEEALLRTGGNRDWGGALREALHVAELRRLDGTARPARARDPFSGLVAGARDPLGGWARPGPDLETTAVAVLIAGPAHLSQPDRSRTEEFFRRCEDHVFGLRLQPDAGATGVGALWGGVELAEGLRLEPKYPTAICESLAVLQRADGGLGARHFAISTLRDTWRGLDAAQLLDRLQSEQLQEDE
ncbi:MAG: hypothetical protein ABSC73_03430 [Acidimicrobiales bacterium]